MKLETLVRLYRDGTIHPDRAIVVDNYAVFLYLPRDKSLWPKNPQDDPSDMTFDDVFDTHPKDFLFDVCELLGLSADSV